MIARVWAWHVARRYPTANLLMQYASKDKDGLKHHPATCGARPRTMSGGYEHWYCQRGRFHFGSHRFNSYVWRRIGLGRCHYKPVPLAPSPTPGERA